MKVIADMLPTTQTVSQKLTAQCHHQELLSRRQAFCNTTVQFAGHMDYHKTVLFWRETSRIV
jgi:hypothetical protein